jgi:hypothetical protein
MCKENKSLVITIMLDITVVMVEAAEGFEGGTRPIIYINVPRRGGVCAPNKMVHRKLLRRVHGE